MDKITEFKPNVTTGQNDSLCPHLILNSIRAEYQSYYDELLTQFEKALDEQKKECVIDDRYAYNTSIDTPFLMGKAVEKFRFDLTMKKYSNEYTMDLKLTNRKF